MKKSLFLLGITALLLSSCKKDEQPTAPDLENTINGNWDVTFLTYSATVPYPINGQVVPVPVTGDATNCGPISFDKATKGCSYDIKFKPSISGIAVDLDTIVFKGQGNYVINSQNQISVTDTILKQTFVWNVESNQATVQRWGTVVPYQVDSVNSTNVSMKITFNKR